MMRRTQRANSTTCWMRTCPNRESTCASTRASALGIATYRTQTAYPVVQLLLCDDAPQFNWLTAQLALCWIHEYRHYKKLLPRFLAHCHILEQFAKDFWKLYRDLLAYRDHPSSADPDALRVACDQRFGHKSGWAQSHDR